LLYQATHDRAADKQCTAFRVYAIVRYATLIDIVTADSPTPAQVAALVAHDWGGAVA